MNPSIKDINRTTRCKKLKNLMIFIERNSSGVSMLQTMRVILPFLLVLAFSFNSKAQLPVVKATTDTTQIRIGEQFKLNFSATVSAGTKISFPLLTDTFNHFEIVSKSPIDTVITDDKKSLTLRQQLTLTSFDSGYFVIPPMPFVISRSKEKTDTVLSEAMLMTVITVPVDTTKDIRAIKNIIDVPFPWLEYLIYVLIAWVFIALIIYLYNKFKKKKVPIFVPKIPERPAHEIALEGLKRIEEEKLWQQGYTKKYYSEVTDVVRQYIERRFSINAMEQTTDETLKYFTNSLIREEEKEKLQYILKLADMVKFAKALSIPSENESTMQFAYAFINNTRPVIKEDLEIKEELK